MGCFICQTQPDGNSFQGESQLFDRSMDLLITFRQGNDKYFYGYPNYNQLTSLLAFILSQKKDQWITYEESLQTHQQLVNKYRSVLQDIYSNQPIRSQSIHESVTQDETQRLPPDFNLNFSKSLIVEVQDCIFTQLNNFQPMMNKQLQIKINLKVNDQLIQYATESEKITQRITRFDSVHILKSPNNIQDSPNTEEIKTLKGAQFSIQLYIKSDNEGIQKIQDLEKLVGKQVTFDIREFSDYKVHEKVLKVISSEPSSQICKVTMRFQLLDDLELFFKWWLEELKQREVQLKLIFEKMLMIRSSQPGSVDLGESVIQPNDRSKRFESLMSYDDNSIRHNESRMSVYDLPYKFK